MKHCRIILAPLAILILMILGGCMDMDTTMNDYQQEYAQQRDMFLNYMEEKYGQEFLPISYESESVIVQEEFRCYAEGTDRERDYVRVRRSEKDGQTVFQDDYFGVLIRPEYQRRVQAVCDTVFPESKAFIYRYTARSFDNALTADSTLEDAIAMGVSISASKYVFVEVAPGTETEFQAKCDQVLEELAREGLTGTVVFAGLTTGELEDVEDSNFLEAVPNWTKPDGLICQMLYSGSAY